MILSGKQAPLICNSSLRVGFVLLGALVALWFGPSAARSQTAVQLLGSDRQISGNQVQFSDPEYYNLKAGPVDLRFQSGLGVSASDNVNYTDTNRSSDLIFDPELKLRAFWPVTLDNSLYFNTGLGYMAYVKNSNLDHLTVNPDSNLSFQMYVSDVSINFHDRFSMSDNLSQAPTVSGTGTYLQLENVSGIDAICPLNDLILTVGYDHDWVTYSGSEFEASADNADYLYGEAAVTNSLITYGAEVGTGLTYYDQHVFSDNFQANAGGFIESQITEHLSGRASAGVASYFFSSGSADPNLSDVVGYYADLSLNHQINQWLSHSLTGGHRYEEGANVDLLELYYVYYNVEFSAIHELPITLRLIYEHGKEFGGTDENFDHYGVALKVKHDFNRRLTGVAEYDFTDRESSINLNSYYQNQVNLQLVYNF